MTISSSLVSFPVKGGGIYKHVEMPHRNRQLASKGYMTTRLVRVGTKYVQKERAIYRCTLTGRFVSKNEYDAETQGIIMPQVFTPTNDYIHPTSYTMPTTCYTSTEGIDQAWANNAEKQELEWEEQELSEFMPAQVKEQKAKRFLPWSKARYQAEMEWLNFHEEKFFEIAPDIVEDMEIVNLKEKPAKIKTGFVRMMDPVKFQQMRDRYLLAQARRKNKKEN